MAGSWYVLIGKKPVGPASSAELLRAHFLGRYGPDALVRSDDATDWQELGKAFPLADLMPPALTGTGDVASANDPPKAKPVSWSSDTPFAWRRYFARQLDTLIHAWVMFTFLGAVLAGSDAAYLAMTGLDNAIVLNIIGVTLAVLPGAILIGITGRTLGKLIFGLKVLNANQSPPGIGRALRRELQVLFQGLALGIPIFSLIAFIAGYSNLQSAKGTDWDVSNELTTWYRPPTVFHWLLMLGGIALWLSILAILYTAGSNAG